MKQSKLLPLEECQLYRGGRKGSPQVWGILLLLLLTTSAWLCLLHSRNLGITFQPSSVHIRRLFSAVVMSSSPRSRRGRGRTRARRPTRGACGRRWRGRRAPRRRARPSASWNASRREGDHVERKEIICNQSYLRTAIFPGSDLGLKLIPLVKQHLTALDSLSPSYMLGEH